MGITTSLLLENIWNRFRNIKECRIIMVGLDGAGKTSILYKLKLGEVVSTIPTIGFNVESVQYKNITFSVWDVGGQAMIRRLWHHYYNGNHGIIFVVDSSDLNRIEEAAFEVQNLLNEDLLRDAVLLVYANKQDLPNAMSASELTEKLGLSLTSNRKWFVQPSCAVSNEGLIEGLDWLNKALS